MPMVKEQQKYSFELGPHLFREFDSCVPRGLRSSVIRGMFRVCLDAINHDQQFVLDLMGTDPDSEISMKSNALMLVRRDDLESAVTT